MNIILCCWHVTWHLLTDMADMLTNIVYYFKWGLVNMLTWQSCNIKCWHDDTFTHQSISAAESPPPGICHPRQKNANAGGLGGKGGWLGGAGIDWCISSQDPRNLWLCLVCLVNNFDLPLLLYPVCVHLTGVCMLKTNFCINNCYFIYFFFFHFY